MGTPSLDEQIATACVAVEAALLQRNRVGRASKDWAKFELHMNNCLERLSNLYLERNMRAESEAS